MQNSLTQQWIERFEEAEKEILSREDATDFDRIMLQAYRSQIISLKMELEKEQRHGPDQQAET